jgi:uncharacterized protein (TIGR00725 family)
MRDLPRIAVCGPGAASEDEWNVAFEIGAEIARRGAVLLCGGLGGAMEAACHGAKEAGGLTVGILPGTDASEANRWVDIPIVTGMGQARNVILVSTADGVIATGGGFGTLSEIAHALRLSRPLVLHRGWADRFAPTVLEELQNEPSTQFSIAATPTEAVATALTFVASSSRQLDFPL